MGQNRAIKDVEMFQGGGVSQIPMLKDIRRQDLGKSGPKFRHGEGGYQKRPKNYDVFYGRPLARFHNIFTAYLSKGRTLELLTLKCMLQQSEWKFQEFSDSLCLRKQGFKVFFACRHVVWFLSVNEYLTRASKGQLLLVSSKNIKNNSRISALNFLQLPAGVLEGFWASQGLSK